MLRKNRPFPTKRLLSVRMRPLFVGAPSVVLLALLLLAGANVVGARETVTAAGPLGGPPVVLLHGLFRTGASMSRMEAALVAEGYRVCNVTYPSRSFTIEVLAAQHVSPAVKRCFPEEQRPVDFVTHSMGGILARQLAATDSVDSFGRVVMLGPPNGGSEIVDEFGDWWWFRSLLGPAGQELGTSPEDLPKASGPAPFELGVIAGNLTLNLLSSRFLPGENDGKVSVNSTRLEGMRDFLVIRSTHTFMMRSSEAIEQTLAFLKTGAFVHSGESGSPRDVAAARL